MAKKPSGTLGYAEGSKETYDMAKETYSKGKRGKRDLLQGQKRPAKIGVPGGRAAVVKRGSSKA